MTSLIRPLPPSPGAPWKAPPRHLYQPTEYDIRTGLAPRRYLIGFTQAWSGVSMPGFISAAVPANKVLKIDYISVSGGSGAGTTEVFTFIELRIDEVGGSLIAQLINRSNFNAAGLGSDFTFNLNAPIMLMPGETLRYTVTKSAAVNTFTAHLAAIGHLIPRANIQSG